MTRLGSIPVSLAPDGLHFLSDLGSWDIPLVGGIAAWGTITGTLTSQTDLQAALDAKVATSRTISTTAPLTGGGDLSANRTLAVSAATTSVVGVVELATDGESAASVVVQGNDSRLSDSRTTSYSPGSFTVATERFVTFSRHLKLITSQRIILQGTATLRIT